MLIQLSGDVGRRYKDFLKAFEIRYNRIAKAPERVEAYICAKNNKHPSWMYL